MDRKEFARMADSGIILLDGAMGSNMTKAGMPRNICVEAWILEHEETAVSLQRQYVEAGSRILYAPTFAANRICLKKFGKEQEVKRLNTGLVQLTRKAAGNRALVAGDLTTTGQLLEPLGDLTEEELYEVYCEQIRALDEAGADLLVAETMLSLPETEVALKAARDTCGLPVICTLTVQENGRALFGGTAAEAVETLQEQGASAVGVNCSVGPDQLKGVVRSMKEKARIPLVVKPNAGIPETDAHGEAVYRMTPEEFAGHMKTLIDLGAGLVGGCCGTTPEYIRRLAEAAGLA
jgi:5-methyltetrahydrofolate--homocysteine methyltransferase